MNKHLTEEERKPVGDEHAKGSLTLLTGKVEPRF